MNNFDIIVVGGGPAGLTSAYQLNKYGFNVLLVDKNTFPRPKLCAGLLTKKTRKLVNDVFSVTTSDLKEKEVVDFCSDYYQIFFKDKLIYESEMEDAFYYVHRRVYDNFLFNLVKNTGVKIKEGTEVRDIDLFDSKVITKNGNEFKADYIIGADGANSVIRKKIIAKRDDIKFEDFKKNMAVSLEAIVPRSELKLDFDHPILYYGILNWGYGWIFPRKDSLVIGIAGLKKDNKNFKDIFKEYLDLIGIKNKDINYTGWQLPYGNFLKEPFYNNTLLVGDAAGLVEPLTGEGIYYAHHSGLLAAKAINKAENYNRNLISTYKKSLDEEILLRLDRFKKLSKFFYGQPAFMQKFLLSLATKTAGNYLTDIIQEVKDDR